VEDDASRFVPLLVVLSSIPAVSPLMCSTAGHFLSYKENGGTDRSRDSRSSSILLSRVFAILWTRSLEKEEWKEWPPQR